MFSTDAIITVIICIVAVIAANEAAKKCRQNPKLSTAAKILIPIAILAVAFIIIFLFFRPQ